MYEKKAHEAFQDAFTAEFQKRLVKARKELDLEQDDMADRLGVSRSTYPKYETRSPLPLCLFPALIAVTDKPIAYWTMGMPAPPGASFDTRRRMISDAKRSRQ